MKENEPKFQAELYQKGRPLYPEFIFRPLEIIATPPTHFLDLGCGTGQSFLSFLKFTSTCCPATPRGTAIDPDIDMLSRAEQDYHSTTTEIGRRMNFRVGTAEVIPLDNSSVDLVLVGSAYHWFSRELAGPEILRVLRPGGALFIFEYQFPKCLDSPSLHDFVKRRFNTEWKAPTQLPRGTLQDLTRDLRSSPLWKLCSDDRPEWQEILGLDAFLGHLFSQSRFHHAEALQPSPLLYRENIRNSLFSYFSKPLRFDLKPRSLLFQKLNHSAV